MKHRLIVLSVLAVMIVGVFSAGALGVQPSCPTGNRQIQSGDCLSTGEHIAPSSGVLIPNYVTSKDPHNSIRAGLFLTGLLLAGGIVWIGRRERGTPETLQAA